MISVYGKYTTALTIASGANIKYYLIDSVSKKVNGTSRSCGKGFVWDYIKLDMCS